LSTRCDTLENRFRFSEHGSLTTNAGKSCLGPAGGHNQVGLIDNCEEDSVLWEIDGTGSSSPIIRAAYADEAGGWTISETVLRGEAGQAFAAAAGQRNARVVAGDVDDDGNADLVVATGNQDTIHTAFSNGDGTWEVLVSEAAEFVRAARVVGADIQIGDFNGDGRSDILAMSASEAHHVALSTGDGRYVTKSIYNEDTRSEESFNRGPLSVFVGDHDGFGKDDITLLAAGSDTYLS